MVPNQWYVVLDSGQVKKKPISVMRLGERLVFWRDNQGKVCCLQDKCSHRGAQLSKGKVQHDHIQCPFHGLEFDASGKCTIIPANGRQALVPENFNVQHYPTYEAQGFIWIWWGKKRPAELPEPRFFNDIDASFSSILAYDHWKAHYSRVIENQLDVMHLPFVHHNTIGRGGKTLVDGPGVEILDDFSFNLYVFNREDDGTPPLKTDEVPVPDPAKDFKIEFIFPNLWQNYLSSKARIVVAFVPVDEENTIVYIRFYQKLMRIPGLQQIFNWLAVPLNKIILHQDRRVVETQLPKKSGLKIGENLAQGDYPIILYRRLRQKCLDELTG